ncbi:MAG: alpha-1,4-glucan--maltose-1-phosphate maltosyltransferase [Myxococcales bacterium]|nr:alpha-1,4-glucan--maltose-1-phosphate maltosyltransferase [Myxococcales bacterium]
MNRESAKPAREDAPAHPGASSGRPSLDLSGVDLVPRAVIDAVRPEIDGGRHPIKRVVGQEVRVSARIYADGHDHLAAVLRYRCAADTAWREVRMASLEHDRFEAAFRVERLGDYAYTIEAWVDAFASWRDGLERKVNAGLDVRSELLEGAVLVRAAAERAATTDASWLRARAELLASNQSQERRVETALSIEISECMDRHPDRSRSAHLDRVLHVQVERERARTGAWYEFFPRSCADEPGRHGTFRDCERRLAYVASMGFDVVYLPPIHPIGVTHRKGAGNKSTAQPGDPGSVWAIGSAEGGHKAVHPALGSLADFEHLVESARELGLEIALDLAFQCSPDHPYVEKHPTWFRRRPDGTVHHAENPPKKYEDIYPFDFESEHWRELWMELKSVVSFWIDHGVRIFRVDNPHTKPFAFWEWLIREVRETRPDVVFLSEAFARPAVMQLLAKIGFSQSYSYFTWRNTKEEITQYFTELSSYPNREYLRPNLFANTPDILHEYLQTGKRAAFQTRLVLAATLSGSYGIYGPPFELCIADAVPGSEEYRGSEKYQLVHWDLEREGHIRETVARINEIRRENPAITRGRAPEFYPIDDDELLAYGRTTQDGRETLVVVVNLDPHYTHSGWLDLPLEKLGIDSRQPFQVEDLLGGARYLWHGSRNYVSLDPASIPAHIFRLRRRVRTERDFDYYL